jgi:hypothetical protein
LGCYNHHWNKNKEKTWTWAQALITITELFLILKWFDKEFKK